MTGREGKPPAVQWYVGDALADENMATMSLEEEGAYRRLLDYHWREGSIPADHEELRRLLKWIPRARFRRLWVRISGCFRDAETPGRLINPRMDADRKDLARRSAERAESGRKGAEARWYGHGSATRQPLATDGPAVASAVANEEPTLARARDGTGTGPDDDAPGETPTEMLIRLWDEVVNGDYGPGGYDEGALQKIAKSASRQDPPAQLEAYTRAVLHALVAMCSDWRSRAIPATPTIRFLNVNFHNVESWMRGDRVEQRKPPSGGGGGGGRGGPGRLPVSGER